MAPQPGGIPGVLSNQPGQQQPTTVQNVQSQRQQESINYRSKQNHKQNSSVYRTD